MTWTPPSPPVAQTARHPVVSETGQLGYVRVERSGPPLFRIVALAGFVRDEEGRVLDLAPTFKE